MYKITKDELDCIISLRDRSKKLIDEVLTRQKELDAFRDHCSKRVKLNDATISEILSSYSPYQVGDKVLIRDAVNVGTKMNPKWEDLPAYISKVIAHPSIKNGDVDFEYKVNRVKKDGSMSKQSVKKFKLYACSECEIIKKI